MGVRGTSNSNQRGSTRDRRARKTWLMKTFATLWEGVVLCYRCGGRLTIETVTIDRIQMGKNGGRYTRDNIRPACAFCNSATGKR